MTYRFAFALFASLLLTVTACAQEPVTYDSDDYFGATAAQAALPAEQLDPLVAPVALYPDALLAQVLAASTYPDEITAAAGWMRQNSSLKGSQLADAIDAQPWDPSVKALTQFASVLANLDRNRSWTSALGEAYMNQPGAVMQQIQALRQRAQAGGALRSTSQQSVTTQDGTIAIEPANPAVVYVPAYDPWLVYGTPILAYPGWVAVPGVYYAGPGIYWGLGFDVGLFAGYGWGWHHWGLDWHHRALLHDHAPWFSHGRPYAQFSRPGAPFEHRAGPFEHPGPRFDHPAPVFHGPGPHPAPGFHGGAELHGEGGFHGEGRHR
jgi:hypothetical protein